MGALQLGDIEIEVVQKNIRHLHLSVYPPHGKVKIAAPKHLKLDAIRIYALSKLSWIKKQQIRLKQQERETERDYVARESHYYLGRRYLMKIIERDAAPEVQIKYNRIELYIRPGTTKAKRHEIMDTWYRNSLKDLVPQLIEQYSALMQVKPNSFGIKRMKTKWGTCNTEARRIWINLELAKKPRHCIEYIVVHEMVHLLEKSHNQRFVNYMDRFLPNWRYLKEELNKLPVRHGDW